MKQETKEMILNRLSMDELRGLQLSDPVAFGLITAPNEAAGGDTSSTDQAGDKQQLVSKSDMSRADKLAFIKERGYDAFMNLAS